MINKKFSKNYPVLSAQHLTDCSKGTTTTTDAREEDSMSHSSIRLAMASILSTTTFRIHSPIIMELIKLAKM
jgi:hypothetical protein